MNCKTYRLMLHTYISNELNILEKTSLEKHLMTCNQCSNELTEIKKFKKIISAARPSAVQMYDIKANIMSSIKVTAKARKAVYDIKVLSRLGASLIACGMLSLLINFTILSDNLGVNSSKVNFDFRGVGHKIIQPITVINKGLINMSSGIVNLNGITFRLEQKIRGGMLNEM